MDGDESQTPIVLGSLPHIEIPTLIQNNQQFEDVGDDSKSSNVFTRFASLFLHLKLMLMMKIIQLIKDN